MDPMSEAAAAADAPVCPNCRVGQLARQGEGWSCNNPACAHDFESCPRCGLGLLVRREGRFGAFMGCTRFATSDCHYTKKIPR